MRSALYLLAMLFPFQSSACSFAMPSRFEFDSALRLKSEVPPIVPEISIGKIWRGKVSEDEWSCDDTGLVVLTMPINKQTKELVFSFRIISGNSDELTFEKGFYRGVTRAGSDRMTFAFPWVDGAVEHQEPLDFILEITPARKSGLIGTPVTIVISDPGR